MTVRYVISICMYQHAYFLDSSDEEEIKVMAEQMKKGEGSGRADDHEGRGVWKSRRRKERGVEEQKKAQKQKGEEEETKKKPSKKSQVK